MAVINENFEKLAPDRYRCMVQVLFKHRSSLTHYNRTRPITWGRKLWYRAEVSPREIFQNCCTIMMTVIFLILELALQNLDRRKLHPPAGNATPIRLNSRENGVPGLITNLKMLLRMMDSNVVLVNLGIKSQFRKLHRIRDGVNENVIEADPSNSKQSEN
jgi:hypothetical protein